MFCFAFFLKFFALLVNISVLYTVLKYSVQNVNESLIRCGPNPSACIILIVSVKTPVRKAKDKFLVYMDYKNSSSK